MFLAYEVVVIALLALLWDTEAVMGAVVTYLLVAVAAVGYFVCALSAKAWSLLSLVLPLPVVWGASSLVDAGGSTVNDEWSLLSAWLVWTLFFFLPACGGGLLIGSLARD